MPLTTSERDRIERRKNGVFVFSMLGGLIALFAGFGIAMSACAHSIHDVVSSLDLTPHGKTSFGPDVQPIPIPQSACPYLRVVSVSAKEAAAADHVPGPVAADFRTVREKVEVGRLGLPRVKSVQEYFDRYGVADGYIALRHASGLVGDACGFELAPLVPF